DRLEDLPKGANVFLMKSARRKLRSSIASANVVYMPRVVSVESAREILGFILRRNIEAMTRSAL
ncbi:MAG: hypothetical protein M3R07_06010, partial [Gemmatimonadota bacterium]|nr:hypothetical protein [Gemmatimonadota bacterium]